MKKRSMGVFERLMSLSLYSVSTLILELGVWLSKKMTVTFDVSLCPQTHKEVTVKRNKTISRIDLIANFILLFDKVAANVGRLAAGWQCSLSCPATNQFSERDYEVNENIFNKRSTR